MSTQLKLKAETAEDITVLSSALQDAILRVGEIHYSAKSHAFTLRLSRFRHEADGKSERVLCGLRFDGVLSVSSKGLKREDSEAFAVLIAMTFTPDAAKPAGIIHLVFAGGGEIRLQAECIDAVLADVSEPRTTKSVPLHPQDGSDN